jgi:hypothetical protein
VENSDRPNCYHDKAAPTANNKLRKYMPANTERRSSHAGMGAARTYPSPLLPSRQSLLAALARLDFEHESDIETIRNSSAEEWLKQSTIRKLQERHQERRVPYVRRLASLQRQIQALAA